MVFSSTVFLFLFLPITLIIYYAIKREYQNGWLLMVSLIFFAWSQPGYLWIILISIIVNYFSALILKYEKLRRFVFFFSIIINIGLLVYFKYFDFILESANYFCNTSFMAHNIVLPIGISFFTFQGLSYVIDVYKGDVVAQKNPLKVALYIVFFPQLIAGPIVRYSDVMLEMDNRSINVSGMACGIQRFAIGLAKKTIIANTMAVIVDDIWTRGPGNSIPAVAWLGSIAYTLQIYYDFSGYSDMAIGLGQMFGFHFCENFNHPYISKSITEFWRRWHISLSTWFRDYVYIPLGGNRKRVYLNLMIVFLLTGIWHGASWNFVIWGMWNGIFILLERLYKKIKKNWLESRETDRCQKSPLLVVLSWCYMILVVNLGWVLFRAETLSDAGAYIASMFGRINVETSYTVASFLDKWTLMVLIIGILFSTETPKRISAYIADKMNKAVALAVQYLLIIFLICISALRIVSGTYNPFIYFQF